MVQKLESRPRGRPKAYDPALALEHATALFWRQGVAATTLDDLCLATGMNKPSLYAAWGDKRQWYAQALQAYVGRVGQGMAQALSQPSLAKALDALLQQAVSLYEGGRGCFMVSTAPVAAMDDADIRRVLQRALAAQDALLVARLQQAQADGEVAPNADVPGLAAMVAALLHTLALRARAGATPLELTQMGRSGGATLLQVARLGLDRG